MVSSSMGCARSVLFRLFVVTHAGALLWENVQRQATNVKDCNRGRL